MCYNSEGSYRRIILNVLNVQKGPYIKNKLGATRNFEYSYGPNRPIIRIHFWGDFWTYRILLYREREWQITSGRKGYISILTPERDPKNSQLVIQKKMLRFWTSGRALTQEMVNRNSDIRIDINDLKKLLVYFFGPFCWFFPNFKIFKNHL